MQTGHWLMVAYCLPLVYGATAYLLWARNLPHKFLYYSYVTFAFFFLQGFVGGFVSDEISSPLPNATENISNALYGQLVGGLLSIVVGLPLSRRLSAAMTYPK